MSNEIKPNELEGVDWNRHSVGFGPALKDVEAQEQIKTVHFTQVEMRILRTLLTREVDLGNNERIVLAREYDAFKTFAQLLSGWEAWSLKRGCP